ncbi:hypothetical protein [Nocardioides sp. R-C-SC26]|uniref:hypothetical protein n=1 Tax=Nocardioides sp. R-C-SC26 TaxID=2870414 RepID=UPI001E5FDE0D|nr:hypothetical protein [Nocardioides sp. R-C-SC26]
MTAVHPPATVLRRAAARTGSLGAIAVLGFGLGAGAAIAAPPSGVPVNEQVALVNGSDAQHGGKSRASSSASVTSYDGRWVAFSTDAALVPWDRNGTDDVYLRDTQDRITILVSARGRTVGNDASFEPTVSGDGRFVAFTTMATNLVEGTGSKYLDVVVRDMYAARGGITLASVDQRGRVPGGKAGGNSFAPVISGNGRFVSIQTFARLAPTDRDRTEDVYVRDLRRGRTQQASLAPKTGKDIVGNMLNGDISDDGRLVTFGQDRQLWVRDLVAGTTREVHREPGRAPCQPVPAGSAGRPTISGNGRYVAFSSCAAYLPGDHAIPQIYRLDLRTQRVVQVTDGESESYLPSLSRSGRHLGFGSAAGDLVAGDDEGQPDAFVKDLATGVVQRASQGPTGAGGTTWSATSSVAISGDGHTLVYESYAQNLVPGDASDQMEVFAWRDGTQPTPDRD